MAVIGPTCRWPLFCGASRAQPLRQAGPASPRFAAAKVLLDRGWGKAKEMHEQSGLDSQPIQKIVREIVHLPPPGEIESIEDMNQPLEITFVRRGVLHAVFP